MHWKSFLKIGLVAVIAVAAVRFLAQRFPGLPGASLLA